MDTIIKYFKIVLLIYVYVNVISCGKEGSRPCRDDRYSFAVTSMVANEKEIYNVGDTLYITTAFPKLLVDQKSSKSINYSNTTGVGGTGGFALIDSVNHKVVQAIDSITIIKTIGNVSLISSGFTTTFLEASLEYQNSFKIVLLKKGNYQFGLDDLYCNGIKGKDCTNAGFYNIISNTNKHLDILTNAAIPGVALDQLRVDHIYCFRVQ